MLTAAYRSFSTLFLQDEHVLYFSNAFINSFLRYPLLGNRCILNNTPFFIDNNISRNPLYAELLAQVIPLSRRYSVMLSMNIRNHVIPRFFGRVLSGNKTYTISLPSRSFFIGFICFIAILQGPHQVAQKSTKITLPLNLEVIE